MKNSIEEIWKQGFLNETSLVAPRINDLYNQKSIHVVDRIKGMFRFNLKLNIIGAVVIPVFYYFLDILWLGLAASVLILILTWYGKLQINSMKGLDQGASSFDYLKSFDRWLKDVFSRIGKIARIYYTLSFVIAMGAIASAWKTNTGNIPSYALIAAGLLTLLVFYFSDRIYRWDVRLMYGRVFGKLEETIAEMEKLQEG